MIKSLKELNDVVNDVVNKIVDISTSSTTTGNWYANYDDVSDLITKEDYLKYFDFIYDELYSRPEVLDLQKTDDHEFDAMYGLAYCPNYVFCEGDEKIFHMTEEEFYDKYKVEPVEQPLSMARKAQILENTLANIQDKLERDPEDRILEVAEFFGISVEELARLNLPAAKAAVEEITEHNTNRPIEFIVISNNNKKVFDNFEDALQAYNEITGCEKGLEYRTFDYSKTWPVTEYDQLLWSSRNGDKTFVNKFCHSNNPHGELALAKAILSFEPTDPLGWKRYNAAEAQIGVTAYMMGDDLKVGNWRVHIIPPNGTYGRHNQLVNETDRHIVQFYDLRHIDPIYSPKGQFTGGEYYAETLLGKDGWGDGDYSHGLSLDGSVPEWTVTAKQMAIVLGYIRNNIPNREKTSLDHLISSAVKRAAENETEINNNRDSIVRD